MSENYNFVFIHLTNVRKDLFSFLGDQSIKTPGFDFLANNGTFFPNTINPLIYTQKQIRSSAQFLNDLAPKRAALSFWAALMTRGYTFFESHYASHPIDSRTSDRQVIYPRILMNDDDAKRIAIEKAKEIQRLESLIDKSSKPFVAHFTTDELNTPFQVEQHYYDQVQTMKIKRRLSNDRINQQSSTIFGTSIWEENHWHEMRQTYLGQLLKVDEGIAYLIQLLEHSGQLEKTVIIAYGQGAPALGDHGFEIVPNDETRLFFTNVPLFIKFPSAIDQQKIDTATLTNLADIWPTLYDLAGLNLNPQKDDSKLVSLLNSNRGSRDIITGAHYQRGLFGRRHLADFVIGVSHYLVKSSSYQALFSLDDPYGLKNLIHQKEYQSVIASLTSK